MNGFHSLGGQTGMAGGVRMYYRPKSTMSQHLPFLEESNREMSKDQSSQSDVSVL